MRWLRAIGRGVSCVRDDSHEDCHANANEASGPRHAEAAPTSAIRYNTRVMMTQTYSLISILHFIPRKDFPILHHIIPVTATGRFIKNVAHLELYITQLHRGCDCRLVVRIWHKTFKKSHKSHHLPLEMLLEISVYYGESVRNQ